MLVRNKQNKKLKIGKFKKKKKALDDTRTYLWEPEKLQVEFAYSLIERRRRRAAIICRREWGNVLEKGRLLIVVPLDGPTG